MPGKTKAEKWLNKASALETKLNMERHALEVEHWSIACRIRRLERELACVKEAIDAYRKTAEDYKER